MTTVAGLDLAVARGRASHLAVVHADRFIALGEVTTDDEVAAAVRDHAVDVLAIDAPLTLPHGRAGYFERDAERAVRAAGHRVIPPGLMGALTFRGVALARRFEGTGVTVIETHPRSTLERLGLAFGKCEKKTDPALRARARDVLAGILRDVPPAFAGPDEMDAVAAAVTAMLHARTETVPFGDAEEGRIWLPYAHTKRA